MLARLKLLWVTARDSLWFVPTLLTLGAVIAAIGLVQFESEYELDLGSGGFWFVAGSVDGARSVLSTIAGSLITVTGVVFSVTIVALQLASSQFTPRILRNFMADRTNQVVLGVFIATFTYTLLVLRVVRSKDNGEEFVPQIAVSVAIALALISIGFLIRFVHHVATSIQAAVILETVTSTAMEQVRRVFPVDVGEPEEDADRDAFKPDEAWQQVSCSQNGYLQAVDGDSLFHLGEEQQIVIRMTQPIGAFFVEGQAIAEVWSESPLEDETQKTIRRAFILGEQRTPEQDLEFVLIEIADMAVRALSPGINDPTTAKMCIDRLSQILLAFGKRRPPEPRRTESGNVHFLAQPATFETAIETSFGEVLHYGCSNPAIVGRLCDAVDLLSKLLPAERQATLAEFRGRCKYKPAELHRSTTDDG